MRHVGFIACAALILLSACTSRDDEALRIAAASNFAKPLAVLVERFEAISGRSISVSTGSSGKLYAQISNGAPFDILLSADRERPLQLIADGNAMEESQFTYAVGRLALWSRDVDRIREDDCNLVTLPFERIAIANPDLAPYGRAAREALVFAGSWEAVRERVVMGENVGQAYAQVATGNAEAGLLAWSYVIAPGTAKTGSRCLIDDALHSPIRQDAVLLSRSTDKPVARDFLAFLQTDEAQKIITAAGYGVE